MYIYIYLRYKSPFPYHLMKIDQLDCKISGFHEKLRLIASANFYAFCPRPTVQRTADSPLLLSELKCLKPRWPEENISRAKSFAAKNHRGKRESNVFWNRFHKYPPITFCSTGQKRTHNLALEIIAENGNELLLFTSLADPLRFGVFYYMHCVVEGACSIAPAVRTRARKGDWRHWPWNLEWRRTV